VKSTKLARRTQRANCGSDGENSGPQSNKPEHLRHISKAWIETGSAIKRTENEKIWTEKQGKNKKRKNDTTGRRIKKKRT
jgi:hypothetical protein